MSRKDHISRAILFTLPLAAVSMANYFSQFVLSVYSIVFGTASLVKLIRAAGRRPSLDQLGEVADWAGEYSDDIQNLLAEAQADVKLNIDASVEIRPLIAFAIRLRLRTALRVVRRVRKRQ